MRNRLIGMMLAICVCVGTVPFYTLCNSVAAADILENREDSDSVLLSAERLSTVEETEFSAQERYPRAENGHFLVVENYVDKIDTVPDEKLFGVWDGEKWSVQPILRYEDFPNLAEVAEAAMEGDYISAKTELLNYYRVLTKERLNWQDETEMSSVDRLTTQLLQYNLFFSSTGVSLIDEFTLLPQEQEIAIDLFHNRSDVLDLLRTAPVIEIVAARRDGSGASLVRRGSQAPRLELIINGEQRVIYAEESGTIRAGNCKEQSFPDEERLYIRESETGIKSVTTEDRAIESYHTPLPIDENTSRTMIKFDLSGIPAGQNVTSAVLKMTGATDADSARPYVCFVSNSSIWSEDDLCWNIKEHYITVADGEPYGRYFLPWTENFSRSYRDNVQRFASLLPYGCRTYLRTGDEQYAYLVLTQMCGFFDQLGNVEVMTYTGTNVNSYESSRYGRNSLDVGSRPQRLVEYFWTFIDSEYMTPEIWTSFIKYLWRSGDCLYKDSNYHPTNNWGAIETLGLYIISMYADELRDAVQWMDKVKERMYVADQVGEDMASIEVPLSYAANTTLTSLYQYQKFAERIGKDFTFPPEVEKQITDLFKYLMYASGPGFVCLQMGDDSAHDYYVLVDPDNFAEKFPEPEIIWGASGQKEGTAPKFTSHRYLSNRNYIMRTGWEKNDLFLETNINGGFRNHSHSDDLGIIAFAYGEYLLADCGFDNLNYGTESNTWLSSTRAHNTVEINRTTQEKDNTRGIENEWVTNDAYDYFSGTTTRNADTKHTRNILFVRDGYWIVSDYLQPNNRRENQYVQIWHTQPNAGLALDETSGIARTNFDAANIQVVPVNAASYDRKEIVSGFYSESRGKLTNADYVEYEQNAAGNVRFSTVLVPESTGVRKDIATEEIPLADVQDAGAAAMRILVAEEDGNKDATYYTVNDYAQVAERVVGDYKTNGTMMYVEQKNQMFSKIYAQNAVQNSQGLCVLRENGTPLLSVDGAIPQISVEYHGGQIEISTGYTADQVSDTVSREQRDLSTLKVYAPQYTGKVLVNGEEQKFYKKDGYLYLGQGKTDEQKPPASSGGEFDGGGAHGSQAVGGNVSVSPETPTLLPQTSKTQKELLKESVHGHWAEKELTALIDRGVIEGSDDGLNLSDSVTRAEFTAMAVRAMEIEVKPYHQSFYDVEPDDWYADIVTTAVETGWIHGYDDGSFKPDSAITREELAVIAAAITGGETFAKQPNFADWEEIAQWSAPSVAVAAEQGLITGFPDGTFRPSETALREQTMIIIYRIMEYMRGE